MNISEIVQALNNISIAESNFEFENFFLETFPTKSRQLVAVMAEIEKLYSQHLNLTESFKSQVMYDRNVIILQREISSITQKLDRLYNWYQSIPADERDKILANYEAEEPTYWANVLGRKAALEVLSNQHTSKETMDTMSNLPPDEFEEAIRICNKYTLLLRNTVEDVENNMFNTVAGVPQV